MTSTVLIIVFEIQKILVFYFVFCALKKVFGYVFLTDGGWRYW